MKSIEPATESPEGGWTGSKVMDAFPVASVPGSVPWQSVESDSLSNSLPYQDQTRVFLHQLSQTLTSLHGILELALLGDSDAQEYRGVIQESLAQVEGLVQLFRSYRAFTEGGASDLVNDEVRVGELVRVALEQLRSLSDSRRLAVHIESGDNCRVQADPARLLVALRGGLLGAIQQSPTGGKLEVSLSNKEGSACLTISATAQPAEVHSPPECAEIPKRESPRVLAPDSAEADWTPVRRAVEALGGSVLIESAENSPLICKICLPRPQHEGS
jgi:hypothetical protein